MQAATGSARPLSSPTAHLHRVIVSILRADYFYHPIFTRTIPPLASKYLHDNPAKQEERHSPEIEKLKVEILHGGIRINNSHRWRSLSKRRQVQTSIPDIVWWALRNKACERHSVDAITNGHEALEEDVKVYPGWEDGG